MAPMAIGVIGTIDENGGGGRLWFGVIARPHPSSDKLMRSRVEKLILVLPFKRALIVSESRFYFSPASAELALGFRDDCRSARGGGANE